MSLDKFKKMGEDFISSAKSTVDSLAGSKPEADPSITGISDPYEIHITQCRKILADIEASRRIQDSLVTSLKTEVEALQKLIDEQKKAQGQANTKDDCA